MEQVAAVKAGAGSEAAATATVAGGATPPSAKKKAVVKKKAVIAKKAKPPVEKKASKPVKPAVEKKATAKSKPAGRLWRIGIITNAKTKHEVYPGVNSRGQLHPYTQKRLGIKQAPRWCKVCAATFGEAQALRRAGKVVDWFTPAKGEK